MRVESTAAQCSERPKVAILAAALATGTAVGQHWRGMDVGASPNDSIGEHERKREAALAGHTGDEGGARSRLRDPSPRVRATALGALHRLRRASAADVAAALADPEPEVRRRACEVAIGMVEVDIVPLLDDPDPSVVEVAAWALGERGQGGAAVPALARVAGEHPDALCREAAVAAMGALGDPGGLPAVLAALGDKPAVRRRAVLALAPFEGPEVEGALRRALDDRDRQVRQGAEDLLGGGG